MRTKKGIVTAAKMMNTVTVVEHRAVFHPIYKKRFRRSKKFMADSEGIEDLQAGDTVIISECKPLSKNKCFKVTEVLERAPRVSEVREEEGIEEAVHGKKEEESDVGQRTSDVESSKSEVLSPKSEESDSEDISDTFES